MITPQEILISKTRGKKRHYSFDLGARGTATLQYESAFCKNAIVRINDLQWNFIRKGFWKKELDIEAQQSPFTKTQIKFGWGHKFTVRAEDNNKYQFKAEGFWRRRYIWYDSAGQKLMEIRSNVFSRNRRGSATLLQPASSELIWLMMLGWFQLVLWEEQAAAAAA
jgi:hypothetical protein